MQVVIMVTYVTLTKEWIAAHTGTITSIDTRADQITFDLPKKMSDKTPMMKLSTFYFKDIQGSHANSIYLLDAICIPKLEEQQSQWLFR
ncbi:hypothetical protein H7100_00865 [Candidatus Saccharibacteria bacterium]|nr:hypothetical protein [Candidatus Saccharibacteria bacterium]